MADSQESWSFADPTNPPHALPVTGNVGGIQAVEARDSVVGHYTLGVSPVVDPELERELFGGNISTNSTTRAPTQYLAFEIQNENNEHETATQQLDGSTNITNNLYPLTSNAPEDSSYHNIWNKELQTQQTSSMIKSETDHEYSAANKMADAQPQVLHSAQSASSILEPNSDMNSSNSTALEMNGTVDNFAAPDSTITGPTTLPTSEEAMASSAPGHLANDNDQPTARNHMPPPAAPASLLWSLKSSGRSKEKVHQIKDPAIGSRLTSSAVILFRLGKAKEAKAVGQFAVDLCGSDVWDESLPHYLDHPRIDDDERNLIPLLQEVASFITAVDPMSSAFLSGMVFLMDQ